MYVQILDLSSLRSMFSFFFFVFLKKLNFLVSGFHVLLTFGCACGFFCGKKGFLFRQ